MRGFTGCGGGSGKPAASGSAVTAAPVPSTSPSGLSWWIATWDTLSSGKRQETCLVVNTVGPAWVTPEILESMAPLAATTTSSVTAIPAKAKTLSLILSQIGARVNHLGCAAPDEAP